jgi:hypothetical protein
MTGAPDRSRLWRLDRFREDDMIDRKHAMRAALGIAGLLWALSPAAAQQVEQYSGTRRVDKPTQKVSEIAPPQEKAPPISQPVTPQWRTERHNEPVNNYVPPAPPPLLPRKIEEPKPVAAPNMPLASTLPPHSSPAELPILRETAPVRPASAVTPIDNTNDMVSRAADSCADAVNTRVERLGGPAKTLEKSDTINFEGYELSQNDFYKIAIWQVICTVCGIVLCVLLLLGLAVYVVRKMRHGPLFSVEFVNPYGTMMGMSPMMPMGSMMGMGHHLAPATMHGQPGMPAADLGPMTAQKFDLGPTYEEEIALQAEAEQRAQEAVLKQILDDNVALHEKIEAGEGAAV